jgi:shikimate kinase
LFFRFFCLESFTIASDTCIERDESKMETHPHKKNLIYLAGFMGSGKSTIGPILANTLGYEFVDIDKLIEARAEQRIVDIFATAGEQMFRELERSTLQQVSTRDHCVVSLGGGTIASDENFRLIRESGIIVYLQLSPEEILKRLHFKTDRPMLKNAGGEQLRPEELRERIEELLRRREEFYARADIVVQTDNKRVGTTVDEIVQKLCGYVKD